MARFKKRGILEHPVPDGSAVRKDIGNVAVDALYAPDGPGQGHQAAMVVSQVLISNSLQMLI